MPSIAMSRNSNTLPAKVCPHDSDLKSPPTEVCEMA